jgi:hypothetical protein
LSTLFSWALFLCRYGLVCEGWDCVARPALWQLCAPRSVKKKRKKKKKKKEKKKMVHVLFCLAVGARADVPWLHGLQTSSFVWGGQEGGHFSRLVGACFAFLALGSAGPMMMGAAKFNWALSALMLTLTWWSHFGVGYGLSMLLLAVAASQLRADAVVRWAKLHAVAALCMLSVILPAIADRAVLAKSVLVDAQYWNSVGVQEGVRMFFKGFLLDSSVMGGAKAFPLLSVLAWFSLAWLALKLIWSLVVRRAVDGKTRTVAALFVMAFALFCGRSAFGKFVNLMPFARSLVPFSEFFLHFQMMSVMLIGWAVSDVSSLRKESGIVVFFNFLFFSS